MDELARAMGFASGEELSKLICSIDLSNGMNMLLFEEWKNEDSSKQGLLERFPCLKTI